MAISRDAPITARTGLAARAATLRSGCRFLGRPTRPLVLRCASPPLKDVRPPTCGGRTTRQKAAVAAAALSGRGTPRGVHPLPPRKAHIKVPAPRRPLLGRSLPVRPRSAPSHPGWSRDLPHGRATRPCRRKPDKGAGQSRWCEARDTQVRTRACRWGDDGRRNVRIRHPAAADKSRGGCDSSAASTAREARRHYFLGAPRHSDNAMRGLISAQALSCGEAPASARECSCIRCRRGVKTTQSASQQRNWEERDSRSIDRCLLATVDRHAERREIQADRMLPAVRRRGRRIGDGR